MNRPTLALVIIAFVLSMGYLLYHLALHFGYLQKKARISPGPFDVARYCDSTLCYHPLEMHFGRRSA
jgi:hypothetical protein